MDLKTAGRLSVHKRLGGRRVNSKVCMFWLEGRCNRNPCRFLHTESAAPSMEHGYLQSRTTWTNPNYCNPKNATNGGAGSGYKIPQEINQKDLTIEGAVTRERSGVKTQTKLCDNWVKGTCVQADRCQDLHSWFCGSGFSFLASLEGHNKAVTGIALPHGSDKLYSSSSDKSMRVWDCHTGQCAANFNLEVEAESLVSDGPWIFIGLPNALKAWNIHTQTELTLKGPVGIVHSIVAVNDMLFAGADDGNILGWRFSAETSSYELFTSLNGHSHAVRSLVVGANRLYSSSSDKTIRVWDLETLQCIQTLYGHTDVVMSVLCWDSFLLSGSLDGTIKAWAATERGNIEAVYEHIEGHGVLALCGICNAEAKPILLCSCNDNIVRLYDLPSFLERGRIFAKQEVRVVQIGASGLFFTGDATGQLSVWKLLG